MEAFSYDSQKDYKNDPKVIIEEIKKNVNIALPRGGQQNHLVYDA